MCITTPGKILKITGNKALVDICGAVHEVRIDLVNAVVGEYVYCAAGMAVEKANIGE
ncbi:MAG: HypC/HybG/HupF family hydrogenase formation chaperone [Candidatus Aenigmarchaeota archaeon]|nr:HypC/HybG/HupF family hydrogenase formation chaperone [Candidatus Aenigmarchaeota archaeon]